MRYRIALYDWNGTLANDVQIGFACVLEIFRVFGPHLEKPDFDDWRTDNGNSNFLDFYLDRGIARSVTIEQMRDVWMPLYHSLAMSSQSLLNEGATELLRFCQKQSVPNIIISSSIDDVIHHLTTADVLPLFHGVNLKVRHKHIAIRSVIEEFGIQPSEAFYVDDTHDGLTSAREAGVATFGFTGGYNCKDRIHAAGPDHVVSSFGEIIDILTRQG